MLRRSILFILTMLMWQSQLFAATQSQMDIQSQDALIEKLNSIRKQNGLQNKKRAEIEARLADLYAERARTKEMLAGEKNCNECRDFRSDRALAAKLYESAKGHLDVEIDGRLRIQLAHMYMMNQESDKSARTLKDILINKSLNASYAKAHLMLGEISFEKGDMQNADREYRLAIHTNSIDDQLYAMYRLSWSELNQGFDQKALDTMKQALILAKTNRQTSFQKDLSRDYATMLARQQFTADQVDEYLKLSRKEDINENLKFLGQEAERVGNKRGSLLIWNRYTSRELNEKQLTAETQLKLAQNYYDIDDESSALKYIQSTVQLIQDEKCENCDRVQKDLKSLIVNWTKKEKTEPSLQLSNAYDQFLKLNEKDFQATMWAAQVARERNDFNKAFRLYNSAVLLADQYNRREDLELSLNALIEVAEKSKNTIIYEQALEQYLKLNPKGPLASEILFQRAVLKYKNKKYQEAADELTDIALNQSKGERSIRLQAAELSIESVEHLNDHKQVRDLADKYAKSFSEKAADFNEISRKVTVNLIVSQLANQKDVDTSTLKGEMARARTELNLKLSNSDRANQLRTIILAADRLKDMNVLERSAIELRSVPGIKKADRELTLKSLLFVYESRLDFKNAYATAVQMSAVQLGKDQQELKLGLLAELAGLKPDKHFQSYLKTTSSLRNANVIRLKMIRKSKNKWNEFDKMFARVRLTPDLLAEITAELHLDSPSLPRVKKSLGIAGVSSTMEGRYLKDLIRRDEFSRRSKEIASMKLVRNNDRAMQKSIRSRIQVLNGLRSQYAIALNEGNIALQGAVLVTLQKENARFAREILNLPTPKGLRSSERQTYKALLAQQANPYSAAANDAKSRLSQLFIVNQKSMDKILDGLNSNDLLNRKMAQFELKSLRPFMENGYRKEMDLALKQAQSVSSSELRIAYNEIEKNPLDPSTLEDLRDIEARRANGPLIAYLDQRIAQLKSGARR